MSAANNNIDFAQNLRDTGFSGYTGNQVASFSPQQEKSFDVGGQLINGISPYLPNIGSWVNNYASAGPQSVTPQSISSRMSPYMNQYVDLALAPQLEQLRQQFAGQNKSFDSAATGAGAFGDSSWNLGRTNLTNEQDIARTGLIGNAYNAAFNTAIGAGAQDVANNLAGQTTNANLAETALGRQLTGANALFGAGTGATNLVNTLGGQQTAQTQAQLNAAYNQWLMSQQYPFQTLSANDQALAAARGAVPTSTTTSAPNNAGYGLIGAGLGAVGTMLGGPIGGMIGTGVGSMFGAGSGLPLTGVPSPNGPGSYAVGYADGGKAKKNKPIIVGERGPEVFVPHKDGVVVPNEVMEAAREKHAKKTGSPDGLSKQLGIAA